MRGTTLNKAMLLQVKSSACVQELLLRLKIVTGVLFNSGYPLLVYMYVSQGIPGVHPRVSYVNMDLAAGI